MVHVSALPEYFFSEHARLFFIVNYLRSEREIMIFCTSEVPS